MYIKGSGVRVFIQTISLYLNESIQKFHALVIWWDEIWDLQS